jgi:hypothetical protein
MQLEEEFAIVNAKSILHTVQLSADLSERGNHLLAMWMRLFTDIFKVVPEYTPIAYLSRYFAG